MFTQTEQRNAVMRRSTINHLADLVAKLRRARARVDKWQKRLDTWKPKTFQGAPLYDPKDNLEYLADRLDDAKADLSIYRANLVTYVEHIGDRPELY